LSTPLSLCRVPTFRDRLPTFSKRKKGRGKVTLPGTPARV
jgi:hypothetical protein